MFPSTAGPRRESLFKRFQLCFCSTHNMRVIAFVSGIPERGATLGLDSPFFSTIVLSNSRPFPLGFWRFSRKDHWKEWGKYSSHEFLGCRPVFWSGEPRRVAEAADGAARRVAKGILPRSGESLLRGGGDLVRPKTAAHWTLKAFKAPPWILFVKLFKRLLLEAACFWSSSVGFLCLVGTD